MWRRSKIPVLFGALFALQLLNGLLTADAKKPHIVFVLADDYGFNDVGYHGSEIKTPNLDKISASGVRLENYYVQPSCSPSRSQFMSGRYQIRTGLQHSIIWSTQANALPTDGPTIADTMRQSGYATHMVGKWHLGFYRQEYIPTNRGFDTFYGFYTGSEDYYTHMRPGLRLGQNFLDLRDQDQPVFNETGHYSTHLFTDKAIEIINNHDQSKGLFLYLAYQAVHWPMQAPEAYKQQYGFIHNPTRRTYAAMTSAMDEGIGNLTRALQEAGMWEDTVFVFSTDNGGAPMAGGNNYPLRGNKGSLFEGGIRGVAFVHAANMRTSGTTSRALMHISDWYPTFVGLAGGSLNDTKPLDGVDQWGAISQGLPTPRTELLHNLDPLYPGHGATTHSHAFDTRVRAALRVGDWKLVTGNPEPMSWNAPPPHSAGANESFHIQWTDHKNQNLWLYNITNDPSEKHEISAQHPDVVEELLDKLAAYSAEAVPVRNPPRVDPKCDPSLHGDVWGPWVGEEVQEMSRVFMFIPLRSSSSLRHVPSDVLTSASYFIALVTIWHRI